MPEPDELREVETRDAATKDTADSAKTAEQAGAPVRHQHRLHARQVLRDAVRPSRAQLMIAIILCLASMGTVWQMRANRADETYSSLRRDELIALLDQLNKSNNDLGKQIDEQEELKRRLESGVADKELARQQAAKRIQELEILAGTAPAEGPGITIRIQDRQGKVTPQLLLDAVEEMRDAGAEVMELNGIRVVAHTWFGGGPNEITVNGQPITAPYVLKVIGDPHALGEGARFRGGLVSRAEAPEVGAVVDITESEKIVVTAVAVPVDPKFSKPA